MPKVKPVSAADRVAHRTRRARVPSPCRSQFGVPCSAAYRRAIANSSSHARSWTDHRLFQLRREPMPIAIPPRRGAPPFERGGAELGEAGGMLGDRVEAVHVQER